VAKIGIDAEKFFKEHLEKHYEELSVRIGESVEKAIKEQLEANENRQITLEEALQGLVVTSVGAATGETITFLISAMARAIDVNNAKIYFDLIGSKRKSQMPPGMKRSKSKKDFD